MYNIHKIAHKMDSIQLNMWHVMKNTCIRTNLEISHQWGWILMLFSPSVSVLHTYLSDYRLDRLNLQIDIFWKNTRIWETDLPAKTSKRWKINCSLFLTISSLCFKKMKSIPHLPVICQSDARCYLLKNRRAS